MAVGDKKSVVMDFDLNVSNGVATLDADGQLLESQRAKYDSNINLLDNWYFDDPINQRAGLVIPPNTPYYSDTELTTQVGTVSVYTKVIRPTNTTYDTITIDDTTYYVAQSTAIRGYVGSEYTIDRWRNDNTNTVLLINSGTGNGITISSSDGSEVYLTQLIENNLLSSLIGCDVTISALNTKNELISASGVIVESPSSESVTICAGTFSDGISTFSLQRRPNGVNPISFSTASEIHLIAAKLELGSIQTLAYQDVDGNWVLNGPPPNVAEELAKCQRYLLSNGHGSARYRTHYITTSAVDFQIYIPSSFRIMPSLSASSLVIRDQNNVVQDGFSIAPVGRAQNFINIRCTKASHGLTDAILDTTGMTLDANL